MSIDLSRLSSGASSLLPKEISSEIWGETQEKSAVMQLAREIKVPGPGITIPIITGDVEAEWTGETDEMPVSRATLGHKTLTPYKLSVIEPFSKEFKRDLPGVYAELKRRLPGSIAKKFDATVFGTTAPGSNFATLGGATAVKIAPHATDVKKGTYSGLVEAYSKIAEAKGSLSGWALSSQAKALLLNQVDSTGRPLLAESIASGSAVPVLLGEKAVYSRGAYTAGTPNTVGFAGDWESAVYGSVQGIQMSVSDQASITDGVETLTVGSNTVDVPKQINLWGRDMFAIKLTVEIGFQVYDVARFAKLTDATR